MLWSTVCAAMLALGWSLFTVVTTSAWLAVAPLLVLAVVAELIKVNVYEADRQQRISFSFGTVVTMAAVTINPAYAPLSELSSDLVHVIVGRQRDPIKFLFNLANPTMSAAAAAGVYFLLRPTEPGFTILHLAASFVAVLVYYVVNYGVLSLMISLASEQPLMLVLRGTLWYAPTKLFLGLTGAFLGAAHGEIGLFAAGMFAMPLLIMRFTLSFYASKTQRYIETLQSAKSETEAAHHEKEEMLRKLIETVALIIDARDNSVSGHSRRVAKFAVAIGKELRMGASELAVLHTAGLFHDLGKVGIPEAILHKPSKLTADEYTVIKEHAALGQRILSEVPQLADIALMVGQHHERFDGFGYPLGLAAEQISLGGRILVVADALETMLADRPYSRGRELSVAVEELDRCAGSHFDPEVVSAVHRAVATHGAEFFAGAERQADRNWGAAEQILAQVFA
jgi:HD superfamily phosphohydrolase YqeK